jgi:hypothetical protein
MTKLENKKLSMSAVYSNAKYSKIYKAWHEGKKVWHAISRFNNEIEYFDNFYCI